MGIDVQLPPPLPPDYYYWHCLQEIDPGSSLLFVFLGLPVSNARGARLVPSLSHIIFHLETVILVPLPGKYIRQPGSEASEGRRNLPSEAVDETHTEPFVIYSIFR